MERNFIKRSEIIYPIENVDIKNRILNEILFTYLNDNVKARMMQPDATYIHRHPNEGETPIRSQSVLIAVARSGGIKAPPYDEVVKKAGRKSTVKRQ